MISLQNLKDVLQGVTDKIMTKVNGKQEEIPTYTLAEYEAIKDDIPEGALFNISNDRMITSSGNETFIRTITPKTDFRVILNRNGNTVIASLSSSNTKVVNAASTWEVVCTIPDGYKPISNIFSIMYDPNGNNFWTIQCSTTYNDLRVFGTYNGNAWAFGELVWTTNDEYPAD